MSRRRAPRTQDHIVIRVTEALEQLVDAVRDSWRSPDVALPSPELIPCRLLGLPHVGMLIEIGTLSREPKYDKEPEVMMHVGVLVGITPGLVYGGSKPSDRGLVVSMGSVQKVVPVPMHQPVRVYPRSAR